MTNALPGRCCAARQLDKVIHMKTRRAAKQDTSLSAMPTGALRQIVDEKDGYTEAQRAILKDLRKGYNLGTHGKISWTREDLHLR